MRTAFWVLGVISLTLASPSLAQSVRDGVTAWQDGDHARAVAIWRPLAQKGDADAAFNLGQAYRLGRGVSIDQGEAQRLFEQAARAGHLDAEVNLGLMLFSNGNKVGAMRWLRSASLKNDPRAMLVYGTALYNGDGVPRDPVSGYAYVSRAAAGGLEPARRTLSEMERFLPDDVRKEGLELAARQSGVAPAPASPPAKTAQTAPVSPPKASAPAAQKAPSKQGASAKPKAAAPPVATSRSAAAKPAAASGPWRVQLGAFSKAASASALYDKLKGHAALAGKRSFLVDAGKVTRLQVGPFASRDEASAACSKLSASGQACFPARAP